MIESITITTSSATQSVWEEALFFDDQLMKALFEEGGDLHHKIPFDIGVVIIGSFDPIGGPNMKERIEREKLEKR